MVSQYGIYCDFSPLQGSPRHIICQIELIMNCVEFNLYFYAFRMLSESSGPIIVKKYCNHWWPEEV